jgi:hypothetical protein
MKRFSPECREILTYKDVAPKAKWQVLLKPIERVSILLRNRSPAFALADD